MVSKLVITYPKTPWDVMGCQVATCLEALKRGVKTTEGLFVFPWVGSLRVRKFQCSKKAPGTYHGT